MQVFKLFFKLIKNTSAPIILITVLFLLYLFLFMDKGNNYIAENDEKVNLAVLDYDRNDVLWKQLGTVLEDYCKIYEFKDDEDLLEDKLTALNIDATISVPYGFSQDILKGKSVTLEFQKITNNKFLTYVMDMTNLYIDTAQAYVINNENSTIDRLTDRMNHIFEKSGEYKQIGQRDALVNYEVYEKYFKIAAYIVFTVCLIGTGMALHSFQNIHIRRRNLMSPLPDGFRNFQMFFGNLIFVVLYDVFLIIISVLYYIPPGMDIYLPLFWINLIVFSISGLSVSFFMAMLTKKREVNIFLAFILPLILCFISGVFTSQEEIGSGVLSIAYFTPTYWFVKGNTMIMNSGYGQLRLLHIIPVILTQILFSGALFCIALMISKEKRNHS